MRKLSKHKKLKLTVFYDNSNRTAKYGYDTPIQNSLRLNHGPKGNVILQKFITSDRLVHFPVPVRQRRIRVFSVTALCLQIVQVLQHLKQTRVMPATV